MSQGCVRAFSVTFVKKVEQMAKKLEGIRINERFFGRELEIRLRVVKALLKILLEGGAYLKPNNRGFSEHKVLTSRCVPNFFAVELCILYSIIFKAIKFFLFVEFVPLLTF